SLKYRPKPCKSQTTMLREKIQRTATPAEASTSLRQASLLRQEVSFWQEMLLSLESTDHPREYVERVRQALALAQYRLGQLQQHSSH
ncbi:MAG TPA: hypothetical protein VFG52_06865, partial [Xanthomonadales bacterium]|nr:hypothetical protein [Xanthomonadales bacterium]